LRWLLDKSRSASPQTRLLDLSSAKEFASDKNSEQRAL
jgi:hypothetical protein